MTPSIRRIVRQLQLEPERCACLINRESKSFLFLLNTDVILSKTSSIHTVMMTHCVSSLNEAKKRRGMACNAGHEGLFYGDITHHHIIRCHTQTQAHRHTHTHLHISITLSGQAA